jgi:cytochrome P450
VNAVIASLPGPRGWPLLGNAPDLELDRAHQVFEGWAREYGPLFRFRLGRRTLVGVADPAAIRQILKDRPALYTRTRRISEIFSEATIMGVFAAEGERWKRQRRLWISALNVHQIKSFLADLATITERLHKRWLAAAIEGKAVDVQSDLMLYTVDVVSRFAFGYDGNTLEQKGNVIQQDLQHIFPVIHRRINAPFPYWKYFKRAADRQFERSLKRVREFVGQRIAETRQRVQADPTLAEHPGNLIEAFVCARDEDGSTLNDDEIYSNTLIALLAGEDTTANTLAWMLHFLTLHPEMQSELQREVDQARAGTVAGHRDLRYVDALMSETLRLKPVAPILGGTSLVEVEVGGRRFPKGTDFLLILRDAALREEEFPDAQTFRPERWLAPDQAHFVQRPPTPFGGGPRTCPGRSLAQTEVKAVMTMLAQNFTVERVEGDQPVREQFGFTMGPANLRVRFVPRAAKG